MRRRGAACLTYADAHPGQCQIGKIPCQARGRGHQAPGRETQGNQAPPDPTVGDTGERQTGNRVKNREGETGQKPHGRIRDLQVFLNRLEQDGQDLAINEIKHIHHKEDGQDVIGIRSSDLGGRVVGRRRGAFPVKSLFW